MSASQEQFKLLRLQQPATAVAKDLTINVGWRPAMAWVMNYKAAGNMAIAVDGEGVAGGVSFGAGVAMAATTNGISFHDKGITLGSHATLVREDAAELIVMLFRDLSPIAQIALSGVEETDSDFGKGEQYGARLTGTAPAQTRSYDLPDTQGLSEVSVTKAA